MALDGLGIECRMIGWAVEVARLTKSISSLRRFDAVVLSTPPHATLVAGLLIHHGTRIPFIADFRDPWVLGLGDSLANMNAPHRWLGTFLEPRVNRKAAAVVHNTDIERRTIGALLAGQIARHRFIPNGHDLTHAPATPSVDEFILVYTGHMHAWMDPRPFFAACERFMVSHPEANELTRIVFMGTPLQFGGVGLRALAAAYGLGANFELRPRGTREEANTLQESAAVLLAYDCTHPMCVPAKFFDYAYMRGAMLLLGHPDGAMAEMAAPLGVPVIQRDDTAAIEASIAMAFRRWRDGAFTEQNDRDGIYARPNQAAQWELLLREVSIAG
jgi:hypothetical protein